MMWLKSFDGLSRSLSILGNPGCQGICICTHTYIHTHTEPSPYAFLGLSFTLGIQEIVKIEKLIKISIICY